jgi:hypothetical protein
LSIPEPGTPQFSSFVGTDGPELRAVRLLSERIVGGLGLALPTAAGADSGYPGTTTVTTVPGGTNPPGGSTTAQGSATGGCSPSGGGSTQADATSSIAVGSSAVVVLTCTANATYSVSIDGVASSVTVPADSTGTVTLTIAASDPHLSVNGSTPEPTTYGSNTVTLANTAGGDGATVDVNIPNATTAALGTGGSSGSLAFTGAELLALIIGALFLLATGTLLVVFTRRRTRQQQI